MDIDTLKKFANEEFAKHQKYLQENFEGKLGTCLSIRDDGEKFYSLRYKDAPNDEFIFIVPEDTGLFLYVLDAFIKGHQIQSNGQTKY